MNPQSPNPATHPAAHCSGTRSPIRPLDRERRPAALAIPLGLPLAGAVAALWAGQALAQTVPAFPPPPLNVVQLQASAQREVVQDWLTVVLAARHQAPDAATVQNQLKVALEQALQKARAAAKPGEVEVSTGAFHVTPRYGRDGVVQGWQGTAELLLQGRDVARLSALAGTLPGMAVGQMRFSVSRDAARSLEAEVRDEAIANFRQAAQAVTQSFGMRSYQLREVSIQSGAEAPMFRAAPMAMVEASASSAPVPVEPGRSLVQVTVSGSVTLQ